MYSATIKGIPITGESVVVSSGYDAVDHDYLHLSNLRIVWATSVNQLKFEVLKALRAKGIKFREAQRLIRDDMEVHYTDRARRNNNFLVPFQVRTTRGGT